MRNFGFADYDNVPFLGTNGKMSEISAAMGLTNLESLDEFVQANHLRYQLYLTELKNLTGVHLLSYNEEESCNYQYIVLDIDQATTGISRDHIVQLLWAENILARRYFYPGCHHMKVYKMLYPDRDTHLPITDWAVERVLTLPTGTGVSLEEVRATCQLIRFIVENGAKIVDKLDKQILNPELIPA